MVLVSALLGILQKPTIGDVIIEMMLFMAPVWIAIVVGVLVGWSWRPSWANLSGVKDCFDSTLSSSSKTFSSRISLQNVLTGLTSMKSQLPSCVSSNSEAEQETSAPIPHPCSLQPKSEKSVLVDDNDLHQLSQLVEENDGGAAWIQMMDRSAPNMSYQAWRRDLQNGLPQYRSRSVYEDATPEMVRDFFWDDEFRLKWDDMLIHAETLEECPTTGTMMVQWVRKFPFFCSDREYIIGRRIWKSGQAYYCVTKIDGRLTACEVLLFHHEDMGIPWEIAKLGIRQGMWGAVKKIDPALRTYQKHRASEAPLSRSASMAQINTQFSVDKLRSLEGEKSLAEVENLDAPQKPAAGRNVPKLLLVGGAIALACSLDRGLLTKAVIFGVGRRFAGIGKRC
nr:StAR-related lipid transfer protein 7, mitochondrial [Ipomoea batatas]